MLFRQYTPYNIVWLMDACSPILNTDTSIDIYDIIHRKNGPGSIDINGYMEWFSLGCWDRTDGPAVIKPDMSMEWWKQHSRHRIDGPAIIRQNGWMEWWNNGNLHRVDGPAIITPDGRMYWYINGEKITRKIEKWMIVNDICYPFTPEEIVLFQLQFLR